MTEQSGSKRPWQALARVALRKRIANIARRLVDPNGQAAAYTTGSAVISQKLLMERYRAIAPGDHVAYRDVGWGLHSQHDEDGILLYIFSRIGVKTYRSVEICAGNGIECNTANLLLNHRWTGLLVDGSEKNVSIAREFYRSRAQTRFWPPDILRMWLTRENVNEEIRKAGYSGEIDLLSMDLDGMDYWIWEAFEVVSPRVIVLEYNHLLGPDACLSVPYDPNFVADYSEHGTDYAGASLSAFIKLGKRKGYRFTGANTIGTNAFFVRDDIPTDLAPESNPQHWFEHPRVRFGMRERYKNVEGRSWVEV